MTRNHILLLFIGTVIGAGGNWLSRAVPNPQDPPPPPSAAKVKAVNQIVQNPPDGKPFIIRIIGDPKTVAKDVKFCAEAPPEVEWLGVPSYDNSQVEINNVMHVERERVALTADCFKIGRLDKDQTLTIRYPAKIKQSPARNSPKLKLRNSGDGYSFDEVLGPRSSLDRKDRKPTTIASDSTVTFPVTKPFRRGLIDVLPDEANQEREILAGTQLAAGLDIGVNSSSNRTEWLTPDGGHAMKMAYPLGQTFGAVFVIFGPPKEASAHIGGIVVKYNSDVQGTVTATTTVTNSAALAIGSGANASIGGISVDGSWFSGTAVVNNDPPRPGVDLSAYATLLVEVRGDPGTVEIGMKDSTQPDDGAAAVGFTISGRVTDTTGAGISGVTLSMTGARSATTTTAADGSYSFTGLQLDHVGATAWLSLAENRFNPFYVYKDADSGLNHGFPSGVFGSPGFDPNTVTIDSGCIDSLTSITGCSSDAKSQEPIPTDQVGDAGEIRLAGFSSDPSLCGHSDFCLVLDGATGGNNACAYAVSPAGQAFSGSGGTAVVDASTSDGRTWTASGSSPVWVTITGSGSGNGQVSYQVDANSSGAVRSGSISLSGSQPLAYSITFENGPSATAPAQLVVVTDRLDSSVLFTLSAISLPSGMQMTAVPVTDSSNQIMRYSYDQAGNLTSFTDANRQTRTFVYDALGRTIKRTMPEGMSEIYTYDAVGNRLSSTMEPGLAVTYSYDAVGRVAKIGGAGVTTQYAYDAMNRLMSVTYGGRTTEFSYDALDRLPKITAVSPSSGAAPGTMLSVTITGQFTNFVQGTTAVSFGAGISVGEVTVGSATTAVATLNNEPLGADASIYYFGARWLSPRSSRWIAPDDEGLTLVRPLRVRMLDSGGAHLTVTSEVDPTAEYLQRYQEKRLEPNVPLRPLRVRMLDSGGAHLTVTSEVDPTAAYQQRYQEQREPDVPLRPLRVRMLDSGARLTVESRVANRRTARVERPAGGSIQRAAMNVPRRSRGHF